MLAVHGKENLGSFELNRDQVKIYELEMMYLLRRTETFISMF